MKIRVQAKIVGRVQGVGFRPTVYRYATQLGLVGFVRNDPHGVLLEVEGEESAVTAFLARLEQLPPQQAVITGFETDRVAVRGDTRFEVADSQTAGLAAVHISPDLATCDDCLRELADPQDRRHGYPFINCTNCGPRFTIIRELPYDRANTSMAAFTMCPACQQEYHDPADRRFHAQPDACETCGPSLRLRLVGEEQNLAGATGGRRSVGASVPRAIARRPGEAAPSAADNAGVISAAVSRLRTGGIVAIKSLGGFHLACDAFNAEAIDRLRERKHRPHKPLAVMFRDLESVKRHCEVSEAEEAELLSVARPIVILKQRSTGVMECWSDGNDSVPSSTPSLHHSISPDSPTLGAFLPYTPLHQLLLAGFDALVMTSGNLAEEPIASEESELPAVADAVLTHNRPIAHKCDDSVVRVVNGQRQFFRRARGFVPNAIRFAPDSAQLLAVGGELKNTFCLARDGWAFLSQHLGDLQEYRTHEHFEREIAEWQRLMRVTPVAIAHDLHPGYRSTKWAEEQRSNGVSEYWSTEPLRDFITSLLHRSTTPILVPVQHHHAHVASVMAEHGLEGEVLGVALDGTGYGPDGTIWGGEFLLATRADFERVAHFKCYPLPGGEKAIQEPWRMAVSVLATECPDQVFTIVNTRSAVADAVAVELVQRACATGLNAPRTSSAGRLFDAVAALLGLCPVATYEAQAAIRLEAAADPRVHSHYPFELRTERSPWQLDFGRMIRAMVAERTDVGTAAARFHNSIAAAILQVAQRVRDERGLATVALSGGVFQNEYLLRRTVAVLRAERFAVFTNALVPPNDGGLALGQAAVAAARLARGAMNCGERSVKETPQERGRRAVRGRSRTLLGMQAETGAQRATGAEPARTVVEPKVARRSPVSNQEQGPCV